MASRDRTARKSQEVTAFPPLPRPPKTPRLPVDPRQSSSAHVIGAVSGPARGEMQVSGPKMSERLDARRRLTHHRAVP